MEKSWMKRFTFGYALALALLQTTSFASDDWPSWALGPFERIESMNPILGPQKKSQFSCPILHGDVAWEAAHVFNPAAVVKDNKVYLFYRAEDNFGDGIGYHTSRLGLAISADGLSFDRWPIPVFFPKLDAQAYAEWPGGCEDPRIVMAVDGRYIMSYTQWNRKVALLAIATSTNLIHWKKHGYAFSKANAGTFGERWCKSGSIVCRREGDALIATPINGKYWMYWGEGNIYLATSQDLISWEPVLNDKQEPLAVMQPRPGYFDSLLVEPGPPAILTDDGILLLYNGKNDLINGNPDPNIYPEAYCAGQVLFNAADPSLIINRLEHCFLKPQRPYEVKGQYKSGTVFIEGLVPFQGGWFLYYGAADSSIGVAWHGADD